MSDKCEQCAVPPDIDMESQIGRDDTGGDATVPKTSLSGSKAPLLVEVICERVHCVMYDYAITTVDLVAEDYGDRVEIKPVVRRGDRKNSERYMELCRINGRHLPVPTILLDGRVFFEDVPTPAELRAALDEVLSARDDSS